MKYLMSENKGAKEQKELIQISVIERKKKREFSVFEVKSVVEKCKNKFLK